MKNITALELTSVAGVRISVPDRERLTHLQFRRFAGCPICNLHLRSVVRRHDEIEAAGVREVVFFHSTADELREYDLPFAVIPDPEKRHYQEFGVGSSRRALLHPRTWLAVLRGSGMILTGANRPPGLHQPGGRQGMPADFLVATDGRVIASKYGEHASDQWSVDELLAHATAETA